MRRRRQSDRDASSGTWPPFCPVDNSITPGGGGHRFCADAPKFASPVTSPMREDASQEIPGNFCICRAIQRLVKSGRGELSAAQLLVPARSATVKLLRNSIVRARRPVHSSACPLIDAGRDEWRRSKIKRGRRVPASTSAALDEQSAPRPQRATINSPVDSSPTRDQRDECAIPDGLTVIASMNCSFHDDEPTMSEAFARCTSLSTVFCSNQTERYTAALSQFYVTPICDGSLLTFVASNRTQVAPVAESRAALIN